MYEDYELIDVLADLGWPDPITVSELKDHLTWFRSANPKAMAKRLELVGYTKINNPKQKEGRWKINGHNTTFYSINHEKAYPALRRLAYGY